MLFKKKEETVPQQEIEEEDVQLYPRIRFRPNPNFSWKITDIEPPADLVEDLFFAEDPQRRKEAEAELKQWLREEYGGGDWKIELIRDGRVVRSRTIPIRDEDIKYGVNKWLVYVKGEETGKFYKADVEFAHPPDPTEILDAIGGGGKIRIVGYDEKGKIVTTKTIEINAPLPDWVKEKENSFEKQVLKAIRDRLTEQQQKVLDSLLGSNAPKSEESAISQLINELEKLVKNKQIEKIQELIDTLKTPSEPKKSLTDILFLEPYKAKVESINLLIQKYAEKGDLTTAKELLKEIPDGTGALINLLTAGANLANAIATALSSGANDHRKLREKVRKAVEEREKRKESKEESEEEEENESSEQGKKVIVKSIKDETGWKIKPEVEG